MKILSNSTKEKGKIKKNENKTTKQKKKIFHNKNFFYKNL